MSCYLVPPQFSARTLIIKLASYHLVWKKTWWQPKRLLSFQNVFVNDKHNAYFMRYQVILQALYIGNYSWQHDTCRQAFNKSFYALLKWMFCISSVGMRCMHWWVFIGFNVFYSRCFFCISTLSNSTLLTSDWSSLYLLQANQSLFPVL